MASQMQHSYRSRENVDHNVLSTAATFDPTAGIDPSKLHITAETQNAQTQPQSSSAAFNEHANPGTIYNDFGIYSTSSTSGPYIDPRFLTMLSLDSDPNFNSHHSAQNMQTPPADVQQDFKELQRSDTGDSQQTAAFPSTELPLKPSMHGQYQENASLYLQQCHGSPATMASSSSIKLASPIIQVEEFGALDAAPEDASVVNDRRGRTSNAHLSPYSQDGEASEDGVASYNAGSARAAPKVQRTEDGSWSTNPTGQNGLAPHQREQIRELEVPSVNEIQEQRQRAVKNAEVEDWLDHSEVGSEGDDSAIRARKSGNRPRAKSTNDMARSKYNPAVALPGPGMYIDVSSDGENDDSFSSSGEQSPPAEVQIPGSDSYFPNVSKESLQSAPAPWGDTEHKTQDPGKRYQPPTSNAAMMRYRARVLDVESASLTATLGSSRRMSDSTLGSVLTVRGGISRETTSASEHTVVSEKKHQRKGSFFNNFLPNRSNSNLRKRKVTGATAQPNEASSEASTPKEPQGITSVPIRIGSWGKPRSPKLDTSPAVIDPLTSNSSNNLAVQTPTTPWEVAKSAIRRSRSKSDIGRSRSKSDSGRSGGPGLGELMTQIGGPPVATLASPMNAPVSPLNAPVSPLNASVSPHVKTPASAKMEDESGEEGGALTSGITMDLAVRNDPIIPTRDGFRSHLRQLNPRMPLFLLERFLQEQVKRHNRLLEFKIKHNEAVKARNCTSNGFCFLLGGQAKQLKPRFSVKENDGNFVGFKIVPPGTCYEKFDKDGDGSIVAAQFPSGVPPPPVDMLPAEFECPLCFKVKKIYKPSDWTKHVHEDVQPFTCTFPQCTEPKSFKRKADWLRHENERHRHLESWICNFPDCAHVCYRKDNFTQHLVREHKIPEPKQSVRRVGGSSRSPNAMGVAPGWNERTSAAAFDDGEDIMDMVERSRLDASKQPQDEFCRFCENRCNSWGKLAVHLAKHMEQVSMPIIAVVEQENVPTKAEAPTFGIPLTRTFDNRGLSESPTDVKPSFLDEPVPLDIGNLKMEQSLSSNVTPGIALNGITAQAMHTYPPPQVSSYGVPQPHRGPFSNAPAQPNVSYGTRSYPPPPVARSGGLEIPSSRSNYSTPIHSPNPMMQHSPNPNAYNQQFGNVGQRRQMYSSPVGSSGFAEEPLRAVGQTFLMSTGHQMSNPHSPSPQPGGSSMGYQQQQPPPQPPPQQQQQRQWQRASQTFNFMGYGQGYF